jgi:hypothetical protein
MKKKSNSNRQNKVRHKMSDKLIQLSDEDALVSCDDGLRAFKGLIWGLLLSPLLWLTIIVEILIGVFVFYGY